MTVCRDTEQGVPWAKIREVTGQHLIELGLELESSTEQPDPATWGTSPAAQAELKAMIDLAGGAAGGGSDP